jgi:general secretion pathway protein I
MRPPALRSAQGFTLIEVLVALAIVAVTLAAGISAAGSLTNNAMRMAEVSQAQWCADNQLTSLRLPRTRTPPTVGDTDFTCDQLGTIYNGKMIVRPTPNPNFRRVDAQIFNPQGQPVLTLSTVLSRY